jgi:RNA polymerase sigma factor for flagellar operon FliA
MVKKTLPRKRLSAEESDALIERYAPLVRSIAQSLLRRLPASVELDELMQDGYIGLLGALIHSTRTAADGHYQSYLAQRVRGAMLDGLRENDPGSRRVRKEMRRVELAIRGLSNTLGHRPTEGEVAEALNMPLADYQHLLQEAHGYTLLSLEDFDEMGGDRDFLGWCANTNSDPLAALQRRALQRTLLMAISELGEREEEILNAYYVEGLTMRVIAERVGLSEGRISQIHTQAIANLRAVVIDAEEPAKSLLAPRWRAN